jgi:hypothetical protein
MSIENKIKELASNIDELFEIFYCGYDGMIISAHQVKKSGLNAEYFSAKYTDAIKSLRVDDLNLKDLVAYYDKYVIMVRSFNMGYVCLILEPGANVGRARIELNKLKEED